MRTESDVRKALRQWVVETGGHHATTDLADDTPIFRDGWLRSVQVSDLILFIEELAERPVDIAEIGPGAFRDVDAIYARFFARDHA